MALENWVDFAGGGSNYQKGCIFSLVLKRIYQYNLIKYLGSILLCPI